MQGKLLFCSAASMLLLHAPMLSTNFKFDRMILLTRHSQLILNLFLSPPAAAAAAAVLLLLLLD